MHYSRDVAFILSIVLGGFFSDRCAAHSSEKSGYVIEDTRHPSRLLQSSMAIGGALDGLDKDAVEHVYSAKNIRAMKSAGLGSVSYRLRTELGNEAWHWNPNGTWSDPEHKHGYWTSSATPSTPISLSYGYRLPRRGSTHDQANNDGYSRIDDGDPLTFWKSNPYLDKHFAGENHPQWVMIDLGGRKLVDTIQILWGAPFARTFRVDYWKPRASGKWGGIENTLYERGTWVPFQRGSVIDGHGGGECFSLADSSVSCRCIRVWMSQSSSDEKQIPEADVRDQVGYAIREIGIGSTDLSGAFHDIIHHTHSAATQTTIQASSTDLWYGASDRDAAVEQPGFDRVLSSGLTRGLPALFPLGIVYDTPENGAAEVKWLLAKKVPVRGIELGEEPDGQYMTPEDFGALYLQFSRMVHKIDSKLSVGGPSYQTVFKDNPCWPDVSGDKSFTRRFVNYLKSHNALEELQFFSFESYMFNDVCGDPQPHLETIPSILDDARIRWISEGIPKNIPWYITELGYSPYAGEPDVDLAGAIADAEIIAKFLTQGGSAAYFYGYEPNILMNERPECRSWGNLALLQSDDDYHVLRPFAAYYAIQLLTRYWTGSKAFQVYAARVVDKGNRKLASVTVYASEISGHHTNLLLLNKDEHRQIRVHVPSSTGHFLTILGYDKRQYRWHVRGEHGYASPDLLPKISRQSSPWIVLNPSSICVVEM